MGVENVESMHTMVPWDTQQELGEQRGIERLLHGAEQQRRHHDKTIQSWQGVSKFVAWKQAWGHKPSAASLFSLEKHMMLSGYLWHLEGLAGRSGILDRGRQAGTCVHLLCSDEVPLWQDARAKPNPKQLRQRGRVHQRSRSTSSAAVSKATLCSWC
eukprot:1159142-Pelagomonas_calceolata.AAC.5